MFTHLHYIYSFSPAVDWHGIVEGSENLVKYYKSYAIAAKSSEHNVNQGIPGITSTLILLDPSSGSVTWYKDRKMTRNTTVRTLEIFEGARALCGMCSTIIMEHNSSCRNCKNIASRKEIEHIISGQVAKSSDSLTWPRWNSIKRTPIRNSLNFFIVATTYRRMLRLENIRVSWIAKWCLFLTTTWCLIH